MFALPNLIAVIISILNILYCIPHFIVLCYDKKSKSFMKILMLQLIMSSFLLSVSYFFPNSNQKEFYCIIRGPLSMMSQLSFVSLGAMIVYISYKEIWKRNNSPIKRKQFIFIMILLTWGIPFAISAISAISYIIALYQNGWSMDFSGKICWIENMSLIGTYYTLCIVYFIVSIVYLIISIHRTKVYMKSYGQDVVVKAFSIRLMGYFLLMLFTFLIFITHFVLLFVENTTTIEIRNYVKNICDSIIGFLFVFTYCSVKEVWSKFKNIVTCNNRQNKVIQESIVMTIDTDASKSEEESVFS